MKLVYISGPYSVGDKGENVDRAITFGAEIIELGHAVIVPHLSHFIELRHHFTWDKWIAMDLELLVRCDILYRIPGESAGADIEVKFAMENGIRVFNHFPDLVTYLHQINETRERRDNGTDSRFKQGENNSIEDSGNAKGGVQG